MKSTVQIFNEQEAERQKAVEIKNSYLIESIAGFVERADPFDVLRSLARVKVEWLIPETANSKDAQKIILRNLDALEELLLDIAEASAKGNQLLLESYEQAPD